MTATGDDNSVSSVVATDVLLGDVANLYRLLKPGGHLSIISPAVRHHRAAALAEDAGFEIRDSIVYFSDETFMVTLARKPVEGTVAANVLKWGTGALNIDACRIGGGNGWHETRRLSDIRGGKMHAGAVRGKTAAVQVESKGRWPANLILGPEAVVELNEQSGDLHPRGNVNPSSQGGGSGHSWSTNNRPSSHHNRDNLKVVGGASRFFFNVRNTKDLVKWLVKLTTPSGGNSLVLVKRVGSI